MRGGNYEVWSRVNLHPSRRAVVATASALALMMTATAGTAVAAAHHEVLLEVDGVSRPVDGFFLTVGGALASAGVEVGAHDLVAPAADAQVADGQTIVVRSASPYEVTLDGETKTAWSTADSIDGVLDSIVASGSAVMAADRSTLRREMSVISADGPVAILADGATSTVDAKAGDTAEQLLEKAGISLGDLDTVDFVFEAGRTSVKVTRILRGNVDVATPIPFTTEERSDDSLYEGETKVVQEGQDGQTLTTYYRHSIDGKIVLNVPMAKQVTEPVAKIVAVGTKEKPQETPSAASAAGAAAAAASAPAVSYSPGSAQAIAHEMVAARGWSDSEFQCLVTLWNHESGWNVGAANPSGAYGIPQARPGSKMASAGADWQTNPATQITWGLGYVSGRYGTPCGALAAWSAKGWY